MMKPKTLLTALFAASAAVSCAQSLISSSGYGNVRHDVGNGAIATVLPGTGVSLSLPNPQSVLQLTLPSGSDWTSYTHLQVVLQNMGTSPQPIFIAIASTGLWCFSEFLVPAGTNNTIIIPMDNSPVIGMYRLPTPANTKAAQVLAGSSVDKPHVAWLVVMSPDETSPVTLTIKDMHPVNMPIPSAGIVDKYGQQAQVPWFGKIQNDSDLGPAVNARQLSGNYPYSADVYGGVNGTATGTSSTGRWHTEKQNGTWYIVDPVGNRFFSSGMVGAGASPPALVSGRESMFATGALPSQTDPLAVHYWTATNPFSGAQQLTYNFYEANVQRRVGASWQTALMNTTVTRLKTWAFNTIGPSSREAFELRSAPMPFTSIALVGGTFATISDPISGMSMPDVFDPTWAPAVQTSLATKVAALQGNDFNVGLFVDNELPWAKPFSSANAQYGLGEDILISSATQPAKIAFVNWLQQRYSGSIAALNTAWQSSFGSFSAILSGSTHLPQTVPTGMGSDISAFTALFAQTYYSTVRQKLTALGYQGLYMGSRLLYYTPEVLQASKASCDVVSFNDYEYVPTHYHADIRALDAPVMISEVGFSACDMGRLPGQENLLSERDRVWYYNRYVADALNWPNLVGLHWYKWQDDVVSGRFWDLNNCSQGLVSITDVPYWQTVDAATAANLAFQKRLFGNR